MADYNPLGGARLPHFTGTIRGGTVEDHFIDSSFEFEVAKTYQELVDLLISKHKDYGPKNIADAPGGAINGLRVRMHDKLARINNLVDSGKDPEHESLEDSFKDMANYAVIGLLVLRGKWDK
jgi:hypothetical protein